MALYVFAGKVVRRGSGYLSSASVAAATTMSPPQLIAATGGSGTISSISWTEPTTLSNGAAGTADSYTMYWGVWSESTTGTIGPGGSGNTSSRTGMTGTTTSNITSLAANTWALVFVSVKNGVEGPPSNEIIVTVS